MREEVRDIERLSHMLEAINVLVNYKEHHTLADAKSDPIVYFGLVKHVEIIGVALSKEDAYLVTGNTKHFPKKPIVVTPAEMLEILKAANK